MKRLIRAVLTLLGAVIFLLIARLLFISGLWVPSGGWHWVNIAGFALVGGIVSFALAPVFIEKMETLLESITERFSAVPLFDAVLGAVGALLGLFVASFITKPILALSVPLAGNMLGVLLSVLCYLVLVVVGIRLALRYRSEILGALTYAREGFQERKHNRAEKRETTEEKEGLSASPKILDTSVLIDGRIEGVIDSGFLEGSLIISHYVLEEMQHIADSADRLRRERGRRGLDLVQRLQERQNCEVVIDKQVMDSPKEVDMKLLVLTRNHRGSIVTNDYNLNKVASVQEIPVLNINDLANAVKTVVFPGEQIRVKILREGKEAEQGLAYMEDGTMIVVDRGKSHIGEEVDTEVTSVLQTAAGKMIFVKLLES